MTQGERDTVQALISAAIRVVRTPMTGVGIDTPMARSVFGLAITLAAMGLIGVDEAQRASLVVSDDGLDEIIGKPKG
jgi:hypothetical protein